MTARARLAHTTCAKTQTDGNAARRTRDHRPPLTTPLLSGSGATLLAFAAPIPPPATLVDAFLRKPSGAPLQAAPVAAPIPVRGSGRDWTSDDLTTLSWLIREKGYSNADLGRHFKTSPGNVANAMYRYGLRRRTIKAAAP